jgi:hypothetical protein
MERITPTGWGEQKGVPVRQLGSTRAVIEAMAADHTQGGVFIVNTMAKAREAEALIAEIGLRREAFKILTAAAGPEELYRIPPATVVGIDPEAFAGVSVAMWADMQRILTTRFAKVFWG